MQTNLTAKSSLRKDTWLVPLKEENKSKIKRKIDMY